MFSWQSFWCFLSSLDSDRTGKTAAVGSKHKLIVFCQAQYSSSNCSIQISVSPAFQSDDIPWGVWRSKGSRGSSLKTEIEEFCWSSVLLEPDHEAVPGVAGVALEIPGCRLLQPVARRVQPLLHRRQWLHSAWTQVWVLPLQVQFNHTQVVSDQPPVTPDASTMLTPLLHAVNSLALALSVEKVGIGIKIHQKREFIILSLARRKLLPAPTSERRRFVLSGKPPATLLLDQLHLWGSSCSFKQLLNSWPWCLLWAMVLSARLLQVFSLFTFHSTDLTFGLAKLWGKTSPPGSDWLWFSLMLDPPPGSGKRNSASVTRSVAPGRPDSSAVPEPAATNYQRRIMGSIRYKQLFEVWG